MNNINDLIQRVVDAEKKKIINKLDTDIKAFGILRRAHSRAEKEHLARICQGKIIEAEEIKQIILSSQIDVSDIDVGEIKTKGDVIRESNESLAECLTDTAIGNGFIGDRTQLYNIHMNYFNGKSEDE